MSFGAPPVLTSREVINEGSIEDKYEYDAWIENPRADFYWQMDAQNLVFAQGEASSTWGIAPLPWKRLPAYAHQNSSQSRINWINQQALDEIKDHCRRVLPHPGGENYHRATSRHVPLGKAV